MENEISIIQDKKVDELIKALCKAKKEFKPITKEGDNPFLRVKYIKLDTIVNATEEALNANGLVIIHYEEDREGKPFLVSRLYHESGQSIATETMFSDEYLLAEKNDKGNFKTTPLQVKGSAITYLRRYHIGELLGIVVDDDIDGNAKGKNDDKGNQQETQPSPQALLDTTKKHAFALSVWLGNTDAEMSEDCHLQFSVKSRADLAIEQWQEYIKTLTEYEKQLIDEAQMAVIISMLSKKVDKYPKLVDDNAFIDYFNRILKAYYTEHKKAYIAIKATKELRKWQAKHIIADMIAKMGKVE